MVFLLLYKGWDLLYDFRKYVLLYFVVCVDWYSTLYALNLFLSFLCIKIILAIIIIVKIFINSDDNLRQWDEKNKQQ